MYDNIIMDDITWVHRCGAGGTMRACHSAGPGSIPGRDKFPGCGFFGFFSHLYDKCQEALDPKVPKYHLAVIIILSYSSSSNEWVHEWCVSSFMFVLSQRWPRH